MTLLPMLCAFAYMQIISRASTSGLLWAFTPVTTKANPFHSLFPMLPLQSSPHFLFVFFFPMIGLVIQYLISFKLIFHNIVIKIDFSKHQFSLFKIFLFKFPLKAFIHLQNTCRIFSHGLYTVVKFIPQEEILQLSQLQLYFL